MGEGEAVTETVAGTEDEGDTGEVATGGEEGAGAVASGDGEAVFAGAVVVTLDA